MSLTILTDKLRNSVTWSTSVDETFKEDTFCDTDLSPNNPILLEVIPGENKYWLPTIEGLGVWFSDIEPTSRRRLLLASKANIQTVPIQLFSDTKLDDAGREKNVRYPHYIHSPTSNHYDILSQFVRLFMHDPKRAVEIGVLGGQCGSFLLNTFPSLFLYGVDAWKSYPEYGQDLANLIKTDEWPEKYKMAVNNYEQTGYGRFKMLKCWSTEPAVQNLDFIFIDANHETEFVKNDIKYWYPRVKRGGLIAGHDYLWPDEKNPTVMPGVLQALEELNIHPVIYWTDYWVWGFIK